MKHSVTQKVWPGEVELYPSLNKKSSGGLLGPPLNLLPGLATAK